MLEAARSVANRNIEEALLTEKSHFTRRLPDSLQMSQSSIPKKEELYSARIFTNDDPQRPATMMRRLDTLLKEDGLAMKVRQKRHLTKKNKRDIWKFAGRKIAYNSRVKEKISRYLEIDDLYY